MRGWTWAGFREVLPGRAAPKTLAFAAGLALALTAIDAPGAHAQEAPLPETMKQVVMGLPDENGHVLRMIETPLPEIADDELLVKVLAASINGHDWRVRAQTRDGEITGFEQEFYATLYDVSGVVVEVGELVTGFAVGDEVMAYNGAGGVGHFAIQLAKNRGAIVYTTVSTEDMPFAKALGADHVIDYRTQRFEEIVPPVDVVMAIVGGEVRDRSVAVVKPGGLLITYTGKPEAGWYEEQGVRGVHCMTPADPVKLAELAAMVADGSVIAHVDAVFPMDHFREGFDYIESGESVGKVVFTMR